MAEPDLKRLVASRGYLKTSLTRLNNFISEPKGVGSASIEELVNKRIRAHQVFNDYEEANKAILCLYPDDEEDVNEIETKYFHIIGVLDKQIKMFKNSGSSPSGKPSNNSATALARIKLPEVQIQTFTGKFSDYIPFINVFTSMINDNKSLDEVQKMYYLRSFVREEPYDLIKNLPLVSDSYSQALKILNDRYNNEEKIINDHINFLIDLKPIAKSTGSNLRNFLSDVKQQLAALGNIEPSVKYWDPIVLCILYRKLDLYTAQAYQLERKKPTKPVLADFLEYIERRALALESVDQERGPRPQGPKVASNAAAGKQSSCLYCKVLMPLERPVPVMKEQSALHNSPHEPCIINTQFGHIIAGGLPEQCQSQVCNKVTLKCIDCTSDLGETLSHFWETESVPEIFNEQTSEHQLCESIFKSTVQLKNNQFQVVLPLKLPLSEVNDTLGDSFHLALKRFLNLEKKLHKNSCLFIEYQKFIHEYLALGHGHYVDMDSYHFSRDAIYFLPHHAVIKQESKTTKLRTVFDGSMKTNKKVSLNDLMLNGPSVQRDLFDIIMLFRIGQYTFTTDIRRMFRNVEVSSEYTSLQNILWRDHPNESVKCIRLDTVTYGLESSTYLATACLNELACMYEQQFPLASAILKNSTYVDDVIYSHHSLQTILEAKSQLRDLLSLGKFQTHKWASNDARILTDIPSSDQHFDSVDLQKENHNLKALGLLINMNEDQFKISNPQPYDCNEITKQRILSCIGRFYDPMGFISPIIVKAKAIMQKLWLSKVNWTAPPPESITQEWLQFVHSLASMGTISLKRNIQVMDLDTVQLIGFADASSSTAYGCCIYLRVINKSGKVSQYLLCSKSRINPLNNKSLTVPRLELNAALLLSKLVARVHSTLMLKININGVYLFSDSQIALAWISKDPINLKAYVANRVNVINQLTADWTWGYVDTRDNPADLISRGVDPQDLSSCDMWWHGPQFLRDGMYSFAPNFNPSLDVPKMKSCSAISSDQASASQEVNDTFDKLYNISDINKMTRVLAYIFRFYNNVKSKNTKISHPYLTSTELKHSLLLIIKHEQQIHYKKEIELIINNSSIKGSLKSLHPFLDERGLLRVGGRLHYANIPFEQKHPVLLPKGSQITYLIIRKEHERLLHAGPKLLLSNLNQKFWIIDGPRVVKKITHQCIVCFRQKAHASRQLMGSLPADRVIATSRPFKKVGVDFAGPINVKNSRVRRAIIGKGYICVFVCFTTKAIHLELASDLTTNTFLACLKRFISRRGLPTEIHCDNASTFKGARNQLVELYNLQTSKDHQSKVHEYAAQQGINFNFIPSYSPTFGGLWEAAVKSTKYHLKRILQNNILTYEQLNTVLTEIEAVLNSRPLLPVSASDVNDFSYLTPAHFIIGESLTMYPEPDIVNVPHNRLKFWQQCTNLKQSFWKMWHKQYLNLLQNRPKWLDSMCNIKIGSLVILREDNTPPLSWPMARITNVFPGHDGKVRTVEVKTPNGKTHVRSITKVSVLPIDQTD